MQPGVASLSTSSDRPPDAPALLPHLLAGRSSLGFRAGAASRLTAPTSGDRHFGGGSSEPLTKDPTTSRRRPPLPARSANAHAWRCRAQLRRPFVTNLASSQ